MDAMILVLASHSIAGKEEQINTCNVHYKYLSLYLFHALLFFFFNIFLCKKVAYLWIGSFQNI